MISETNFTIMQQFDTLHSPRTIFTGLTPNKDENIIFHPKIEVAITSVSLSWYCHDEITSSLDHRSTSNCWYAKQQNH
ncbi:hypothetical protein HI914_02613 [Erysiphe necator]|nr:hypothetical protein HI914_02613 [Erysiphe necator]